MSLAEVSPNVYVSDFLNAAKYAHHFDYIFNCTHDLVNITPSTYRIVTVITTDIDQSMEKPTHTIFHSWCHYIPRIETIVSNSQTVLLYSNKGNLRSASTAVAYLIYKHPYKRISDLVDEIKTNKPDTFISQEWTLIQNLVTFKKYCRQKKKIT